MFLVRFGKNLKKISSKLTLHGFANIASSDSKFETIFWVIVQLFCLILCLWLMTIHWWRYQSRPTVTTLKSTAHPVSDIPFPAVTVCSSNIVYKKHVGVYQEMLLKYNVSNETIDNFFKNLNSTMNLSTGDNIDVVQFTEIVNILEKENITTEVLLRTLATPCEALFFSCKWEGIVQDCGELFRLSKVGLGFCCSFNYFQDEMERNDTSQWLKEPLHCGDAGITKGLDIVVDVTPNQDVSSIFQSTSVHVLVHSALDYGDSSSYNVVIQPSDAAFVHVSPTLYTSDDDLRQVSVSERNCLFDNEGDYTDIESRYGYRFSNCILKCKANAIYDLCKCVPHYFPFMGNRKSCTILDAPCLKKYDSVYNSIKLSDEGNVNATKCNCLPQCQDIWYDGYVNMIKLGINSSLSTILIYYDGAWCVEYTRNLNLSWDMLLASLGGIFGLCLGGSLISVVEIVYFLLKTIYITITQKKRIEPLIIFKQPNKNISITTLTHLE